MAKPHNPKPGPGKKSLPWNEDPEILRRLETVEELWLSGYRNSEVANALKVTEATVRRDKDRIAMLWRDRVSTNIVEMRQRSIANFRRIQRLADNAFRHSAAQEDKSGGDKPSYLRLQLDAEREIAKLQGTTAPIETQIKMVGGDTSTLSTVDLIAKAAQLEQLAQKLLGSNAEGDQSPEENSAE